MNNEFYEQYHQKGGIYVIPMEVFEELLNESTELKKENKKLKKQLDYLRSGEYYNQLRFERDMLQQVVDTNGVPSEVYDYIECVHRNTELLEENKKLKAELELYRGSLSREHEAIHRANDLEDELKEYKQKYLNAVADYETAMSEKVELEKQLEEQDYTVIPNCDIKPLIDKYKTQQQTFIKYLEKEIGLCNRDIRDFNKNYSVYYLLINDLRIEKKRLEEILQRYREIIGVDKNGQ